MQKSYRRWKQKNTWYNKKNYTPNENKRSSKWKKFSDWIVPLEWNVKDAYILSNGKKIVDFRKNNLHLVGYSLPIEKTLTKEELHKNLFYLKNQKNLILCYLLL